MDLLNPLAGFLVGVLVGSTGVGGGVLEAVLASDVMREGRLGDNR